MTGTGELDEEDTGTDPLIAVPHKNDLDLGQSLVFEFVEGNLPDAYEEVRYLFRIRGAYSRYYRVINRETGTCRPVHSSSAKRAAGG